MVELASAAVIFSGAISIMALLISMKVVRDTRRIRRNVEKLSNRQSQLMEVEKHVLEKNPDYEDFEQTIANLSEKLFTLVKDRYGFEATTYEEMIEELEDLKSDDEIVDDLESFFKYLEEMEYSDRELEEEDKALIRQAAFRLLRRAGPALEEIEDHTKQ